MIRAVLLRDTAEDSFASVFPPETYRKPYFRLGPKVDFAVCITKARATSPPHSLTPILPTCHSYGLRPTLKSHIIAAFGGEPGQDNSQAHSATGPKAFTRSSSSYPTSPATATQGVAEVHDSDSSWIGTLILTDPAIDADPHNFLDAWHAEAPVADAAARALARREHRVVGCGWGAKSLASTTERHQALHSELRSVEVGHPLVEEQSRKTWHAGRLRSSANGSISLKLLPIDGLCDWDLKP
ncbi:hypothetical protein BJV78DRAFT_1157107 [Lactifluus subvellereus]|nr:hypothetical protein BJV78DRAFT_1157107 [Lactifluus subvellereus]